MRAVDAGKMFATGSGWRVEGARAKMLQGALSAVAAKAREAKAAVGTAVGEIRDALDNPTYADDDEAGEWSEEDEAQSAAGEVNARAGAPVPPPHSVAREGPAPPPPRARIHHSEPPRHLP